MFITFTFMSRERKIVYRSGAFKQWAMDKSQFSLVSLSVLIIIKIIILSIYVYSNTEKYTMSIILVVEKIFPSSPPLTINAIWPKGSKLINSGGEVFGIFFFLFAENGNVFFYSFTFIYIYFFYLLDTEKGQKKK